MGSKEKYVRKSLPFLIGESNKKIGRYDADLRQIKDKNDPKRLSIQGNRAKEEARRNELSQRLKDRLAEIEQENQRSEKPPELLGVAVILPPAAAVIAAVGPAMHSDPEVEAIAVELVKPHEIGQGRKPVSVEEENGGWDITSLLDAAVNSFRQLVARTRHGEGILKK